MTSVSFPIAKPSVAVFSSGHRARKLLKPIERVCSPVYINTPLSIHSAHLSSGCKAVNVFENDDLSAPVLDILNEFGVKIVTIRCVCVERLDVEYANKLGFSVFIAYHEGETLDNLICAFDNDDRVCGNMVF